MTNLGHEFGRCLCVRFPPPLMVEHLRHVECHPTADNRSGKGTKKNAPELWPKIHPKVAKRNSSQKNTHRILLDFGGKKILGPHPRASKCCWNVTLASWHKTSGVTITPLPSQLHPGRLTWNLKITQLERKIIFQTSITVFHVNFLGHLGSIPRRDPGPPAFPFLATAGQRAPKSQPWKKSDGHNWKASPTNPKRHL